MKNMVHFIEKFKHNLIKIRKDIVNSNWSNLHINVGNVICYVIYALHFQSIKVTEEQAKKSLEYLHKLNSSYDQKVLLSNDNALLNLWNIR